MFSFFPKKRAINALIHMSEVLVDFVEHYVGLEEKALAIVGDVSGEAGKAGSELQKVAGKASAAESAVSDFLPKQASKALNDVTELADKVSSSAKEVSTRASQSESESKQVSTPTSTSAPSEAASEKDKTASSDSKAPAASASAHPDLSASKKHERAQQRAAKEPQHQALSSDSPPPAATQKSVLTTVGGVTVYQTAPFDAVIYQSGLNVDADGSPFAYHPKPDSDKGLDYLPNAGSPGNWWGIATENGNDSGTPVVQGPNDPAPGYYVSTTSLEDPNYPATSPQAYVNASEIPFIVLPLSHNNFGGAMGDLGAVLNLDNGKLAYVIAADEGPPNSLGEGSVALAKALGVNDSPKDGGTSSGIAYCFFPRSGNHRPQSLDAINQTGAQLFSKFGGVENLKKLLGVT
ncbi:glycoside hydrolase family 75 protein [Rubritalea marina]|uniref:glycoside hydrolase family 75 protein n=1 Tax=Rubritalea marina TaxID=361055 RepID=UPI000381B4D7|nr:glycoside hydrolase family 75 protein [Rubritalea marina]